VSPRPTGLYDIPNRLDYDLRAFVVDHVSGPFGDDQPTTGRQGRELLLKF
jgi:hypothetical protein